MAKEDQYVDDVEEETGDGFGSALVILTTLVLITAIILLQLALKEYGAGMLKGS
jgi:hypothetical protein